MTHTAPLLFSLAALAACSEGDFRFDDAIGVCDYEDRALGWDEASPAGVVPADLLAVAEGTHDLVGTWVDGGATVDATATISRYGDGAIYRENTSGGCASYVAVPVAFAFETADGAFDEAGAALGVDGAAGGASLLVRADFDPDALGGSYTPMPAEGEARRVSLELLFQAAGVTGAVHLQTEGEDGDVAWAATEPVLELTSARR